MVGYENVGYRVLINNRVEIVRHVDIVEEDVKLVGYSENEDISNCDVKEEFIEKIEKENIDSLEIVSESEESEKNENVFRENEQRIEKKRNLKESIVITPVRRSDRVKKVTCRYNPQNYAHYI